MSRLISDEERRDVFEKAEERWQEDGRTEKWEFDTLWKYIAYYEAEAQRDSSDREWIKTIEEQGKYNLSAMT